MGTGTEGLQMIREEFEAEAKGIVFPTQVRWLANTCTIRWRSQNVVIAGSLEVFVVQGSRVAWSIVKNGIQEAGMWYIVEIYTDEGPDSRWKLCCRWGHIENRCGSKPRCG
jgi:hypothetical protein